MRQLLGVGAGAVIGVGGAGVVVALLIPLVPAPWRSEALTWVVAVGVIAVCVAAGVLVTRTGQDERRRDQK